MQAYGFYPVGFGPRVDIERSIPFLSDHPDKLIARKQFNAVPFITGITENEGELFGASINRRNKIIQKLLEIIFFIIILLALTTDNEILKKFKKDPIESVLYSIGMEKKKGGYEIARKVHQHYFGDEMMKDEELHVPYGLVNKLRKYNCCKRGSQTNFLNLFKLSSDFGFFKCVDETAKLYSKYNRYPTYYYNYGHRAQISFSNFLEIPEELDFGKKIKIFYA